MTIQRLKSVVNLTVTFILTTLLSFGVQAQSSPDDPWEGMNRTIYAFNDGLDKSVVQPVARGYEKITPKFVRNGITNFFNNVDDVNVVINDVLQLKFDNALHDSGRLLLNTTIGLAGFIDVASSVGLHKNNEDFGQTLGHWGVESGPYLVIPFMGASTVRDAVGLIPDTIFNPIGWIEDNKVRAATYGLERVDTRTYYFLADELRIEGDEYIQVREALLERRAYLVADGVVQDEEDEFDF
jgi:phospholipid-binding lipoprotein MlaA